MSEHELWNELGNIYYLCGAHEQAIEAYNKAIQIENSFGKAYSNLATIYAEQEKYEFAVPLFKKSLELVTDDAQKAKTWNRLGNVYCSLKQYQQSVLAYQRADELLLALTRNSGQTAAGASDSATKTEDFACELVEEQPDYQYNRVEYLYDTGLETEALPEEPVPVEAETVVATMQRTQPALVPPAIVAASEAETEATLVDGSMPQAHTDESKNQLAFHTSDDEVENYFPQVAGNPSNNETTSIDTETVASQDNKTQETEFGYEELNAQTPRRITDDLPGKSTIEVPQTKSLLWEIKTETEPENVVVPDEVALGEQEMNKMEERSSLFPTSVPVAQESQQNLNGRSGALGTEACIEEEKLAKQIEVNPRSATTWESLGTLYKTAGRYKEAIHAFKKAISIAPLEVSYYHNLGLVYAAQGNTHEAFDAFQKVLELDPNHSLTHASLGGYYKKMGLDELAQKHIGKAMKQIYESENEYNRACLDAICGNIDQAIELLRIALENEQTYVDWVVNDPDLDPLREDDRFKQLIVDFSQ